MSALNAAALLIAWEEGLSQPPLERALTLLTAAWPEASAEEWAQISIGQRDGCLLTLREELFGATLETTTVCPECGESLELLFSTQDIRVVAPPRQENLCVVAGGYEVEYRVPTSADLRCLVQSTATGGREQLLQRCVQRAQCGATVVDTAALPTEVVAAVIEAMATADPQADVQVALTCPVCQHGCSMTFDILAYLWNEVEDWVRRLLREIHLLASVYGWSEQEILALSARRRQLYLEMIGV